LSRELTARAHWHPAGGQARGNPLARQVPEGPRPKERGLSGLKASKRARGHAGSARAARPAWRRNLRRRATAAGDARRSRQCRDEHGRRAQPAWSPPGRGGSVSASAWRRCSRSLFCSRRHSRQTCRCFSKLEAGRVRPHPRQTLVVVTAAFVAKATAVSEEPLPRRANSAPIRCLSSRSTAWRRAARAVGGALRRARRFARRSPSRCESTTGR